MNEYMYYARAANPDEIWTGPPPAKSSAPSVRSQPFGFHVQYAMKSYTNVVQNRIMMMNDVIVARSAIAPKSIAGVILANRLMFYFCTKTKKSQYCTLYSTWKFFFGGLNVNENMHRIQLAFDKAWKDLKEWLELPDSGRRRRWLGRHDLDMYY